MSLILYSFQSDVDKLEKLGINLTTRVDMRVADHANDVVIRWGKSILPKDGAGKRREFVHTLNEARCIRLNCRKPVALAKLGEVVRTPRMWTKRMPLRKLAVIRPLTHRGGSDFRIVSGPCRIPKGHYATEYIRTQFEARVWYVRTGPDKGHCMMARRVPMRRNVVGIHPCRSEWGYEWRENVPPALSKMVLTGATKLGIDVGAADCLLYKGRWYTLEHNTCPSVDAQKIRDFLITYLPMAARAKYPYLQWQTRDGATPPVLGYGGYRSTSAPKAPAAPLWGADAPGAAAGHAVHHAAPAPKPTSAIGKLAARAKGIVKGRKAK